MRPKGSKRPRLRTAFWLTLSALRRHNGSGFSAALAYFMVFSIAPTLLIAIAIAGMLIGRAEAEREILQRIASSVGSEAGGAIATMIKDAPKHTGWLTTVIGFMTLFFGLAGVYRQIEDALHTIWHDSAAEVAGTKRRKKVASMLLVSAVGGVMILSLIFDAAIAVTARLASERLIGGEVLWQVAQLLVSMVVLTVLFGATFRYLPEAPVEWSDVRVGAAVTAILFVAGKFALAIYLRKAAVGSAFGAAGSIVVVLLWAYWSAQIFFFGLEFTHVYAQDASMSSRA